MNSELSQVDSIVVTGGTNIGINTDVPFAVLNVLRIVVDKTMDCVRANEANVW